MESGKQKELLDNSANMFKAQHPATKKVWQTPTVELISVASGAVNGGIEGQAASGVVPPIRTPSYFNAFNGVS